MCSLLSWFCPKISTTFLLSYWRVQFLITREWGNKYTLEEMGKKGNHWRVKTQGFQYLGNPNWTISNLLSRFCCEIFPAFDLYTGDPISYYPRPGAQREETGNGITQQWMKHRESRIQIGPFATCTADFDSIYFQLLTFILGALISYYPSPVPRLSPSRVSFVRHLAAPVCRRQSAGRLWAV